MKIFLEGGGVFLFSFFTLLRPRYVASTTFCNVTECCGGENYRGDNRWTDGRRQGVSRQRSNHAIRAEPGGRVPESDGWGVTSELSLHFDVREQNPVLS